MGTEKNNEFIIDDDNMILEYCGNGGDVIIPEGIRDIFFEAFYGLFAITSLVIPGTVIDISPFVFERCTSLKEITLKEGVTVIGCCAFNECSKLEIINLPKSMQHICISAFENCTSLNEIHYAGTKEEWNFIKKDDDWDKETGNYKIVFNYNN